MVDNFAMLSIEEKVDFAKTLLNKINSEDVFTNLTNFEFQDVDYNDLTGDFAIEVSLANPIEVKRFATWQAGDEEGASEGPGDDADYENSIYEDVNKTFKTLKATVDGYDITLVLSDVDEGEDADVEIENISHEDAGIGSYEFWGFKGYDSQPYVEVTGTVTRLCDCTLSFFVEPQA